MNQSYNVNDVILASHGSRPVQSHDDEFFRSGSQHDGGVKTAWAGREERLGRITPWSNRSENETHAGPGILPHAVSLAALGSVLAWII